MSWNIGFQELTVEEIAQLPEPDYFNADYKEPREQFQVAKDLAISLINTGVVGSGDKKFNGSLSGHANPNHEPAIGYANDVVSVSVNQCA